jgi:hypothetical protein
MVYARSNERDYTMFFGSPQENRPTKCILHDVGKAI